MAKIVSEDALRPALETMGPERGQKRVAEPNIDMNSR